MRYRIIFMAILLLFISSASIAQIDTSDFCAVEVHVEWPFGPQTSGVTATLIDSSGSVVAEVPVVEGRAEFCDFGFGFHEILIEGPGCHSVKIGSVKLVINYKQRFLATLNWKVPLDGGVGNACFAYVRVVSTDGTPIKFARLRLLDSGETFDADQFGRALFGILLNRNDSLVANAPGFREGSAEFRCPKWVTHFERVLTLKPGEK